MQTGVKPWRKSHYWFDSVIIQQPIWRRMNHLRTMRGISIPSPTLKNKIYELNQHQIYILGIWCQSIYLISNGSSPIHLNELLKPWSHSQYRIWKFWILLVVWFLFWVLEYFFFLTWAGWNRGDTSCCWVSAGWISALVWSLRVGRGRHLFA